MDATAQAGLIRSGEASPRELTEAAIKRIEAINGELNAVIHPMFEKALATEPADGPFRGVPFLLKDLNCHSAGDPMHEGMGFLKRIGWVEEEDTWLARRFREAGFVFLGKTNTPELGILPTTESTAYGPARNPWDTTRSTGGSSGGSAAAVAAGMVAVAHASDGGGSIRIPASCCGLVGLKPSRGRVSLAPEFGDFMSGLVTELVVARSVRDAAAVLEWVADPPPGEPYYAPDRARSYNEEVGADPGRLRIGLMTRPPGGHFESHPECVAAAEATARLLESLGHHVDASYPGALDDAGYIEKFLVRWTSNTDYCLRYWERKTGPVDRSRRRRAAHMGAGRAGPLPLRRRVPGGDGVRAGRGAGRRELVGAVRPAAHSHPGAPAGGDRGHRERRRGQPADADSALDAVCDLHGGLQLVGPARHLTPDALG